MSLKRIVIIGGGISGLTVAYELSRLKRAENLPVEITLLEAENRLGGVIESIRQQDGCLFECGPDSFISEKPAALELCRELGIEREVIGTRPENQRSYVFSGGRLHPVPEGFYLIAPVRIGTLFELPFVSWPGKFRMACEPFIPRKKDPGDESVGDFIRRRFGRETLEKIGQPMLSAVYGGDVARLSLQATFPRFRMMEEKYGSVVLALRALKKERSAEGSASGPRYSLFLALENGLEVLVQRLTDRIRFDVRVMTGAKAVSLGRTERGWRIALQKGMPSPFGSNRSCLLRVTRSGGGAASPDGCSGIISAAGGNPLRIGRNGQSGFSTGRHSVFRQRFRICRSGNRKKQRHRLHIFKLQIFEPGAGKSVRTQAFSRRECRSGFMARRRLCDSGPCPQRAPPFGRYRRRTGRLPGPPVSRGDASIRSRSF